MAVQNESVLCLYNRVLSRFGLTAQQFMLFEECGELLEALAKMRRGRACVNEVITELADVHIMVEELAFFYGWEAFVNQKRLKLDRLFERVSKKEEVVSSVPDATQ